MRVLRNNALVFIDERREKRKHALECVSFFEELSNSNPSLNNNEHFAREHHVSLFTRILWKKICFLRV